MIVESLAGLIVYSRDLTVAANFYRDQLGIPLVLTRHGPIKDHLEASLGKTHVVVLPGEPRLVPSFRVNNLNKALAAIESSGVKCIFGPMAIGDGKHLAGITAPDGFEIRLIEIHD